LPKVAKDCIKHYAYYDRILKAYVLPSDDSRFFNHSKKPNLFSSEESDYDIANRNIAKGEEITIDYSTFDSEHKEKLSKK
jgi:SET domain-containing protein